MRTSDISPVALRTQQCILQASKYYYHMLRLITCVSALVLAALQMLVQHRITGLPVVDASGKVVSSNAGFKPAEVQLHIKKVQHSKGFVADRL
jgi:hypothetical protein